MQSELTEQTSEEKSLDLDPLAAEDLDRQHGCIVSCMHYASAFPTWSLGQENRKVSSHSPGTKPSAVMIRPPVEILKSRFQGEPVDPSNPICWRTKF